MIPFLLEADGGALPTVWETTVGAAWLAINASSPEYISLVDTPISLAGDDGKLTLPDTDINSSEKSNCDLINGARLLV